MPAKITLTDRPPRDPDADFAIYIDFSRGEGSASRVFAAAQDFIRALERLDRDLVGSIDPAIETVLVLEDIEAGSLKVWLRNVLSATDDEAIRELDWKKQVGAFLLQAKYAVLRWADDEDAPAKLPALRQEIRQLAAATDVRHLPAYTAPAPDTLIRAIGDIQTVKERLGAHDRISLLSKHGEYELDLSVRWSPEDIQSLAVKHTLTSPATEMILAVKKPDYLGQSRWSFRHGRRTIEARIEDVEWLDQFQGRQIDVRPGDALRCSVSFESLYGHDNELIAEKYTVVRVLEVLTDRAFQSDLFEDDEI